MELLESPVLDSLFIRVAPTKTSSVVYLKSDLLAKRALRELDIVSATCDVMTFKKAIYQFQELVIFRLEGFSLEDDCGDPISLKSLKVLKLCRIKYSKDESLSCLLSNLPSLKDLTLDRCSSGKQTTTLSIAMPGLQRLTFLRCSESSEHEMMLNVNAPCLEYLELEDYWRDVSISDDKKMEKLVEADVSVVFIDNEKLLRALKSAKRLSLCLLTSKAPRVIIFFDQLVRLEICTCQREWWKIFERVLFNSPKLRFLKLHQDHLCGTIDPTVRWKELKFVPECFGSHFETFDWRGYQDTENERKIASYILRNARRLKVATIYPLISQPEKKTHMLLKNYMRRELIDLSGFCFTCKLVFK